MKIVIHELGDWERDALNTRSERGAASVKEFDSVEAISHRFDRNHVEWMLSAGESVTHIGSTVYQIRRDA